MKDEMLRMMCQESCCAHERSVVGALSPDPGSMPLVQHAFERACACKCAACERQREDDLRVLDAVRSRAAGWDAMTPEEREFSGRFAHLFWADKLATAGPDVLKSANPASSRRVSLAELRDRFPAALVERGHHYVVRRGALVDAGGYTGEEGWIALMDVMPAVTPSATARPTR